MAGAWNAAVSNLLRDVLLKDIPTTVSSHLHWFSNEKATAEVAERKTGNCFWAVGKATLIFDARFKPLL